MKAEMRWESETTRCANYFCLSALSLTLLTYSRTRIGKLSRFTYLEHVRWKVPFDRTRAKPARRHHYRSLAITPTLHPGRFLPLSLAHD